MKLGILTFHSAHNYGATLQAYGLQEYLKKLGHDVYVIDYRPDYISFCYPRDGKAFWMSRSISYSAEALVTYLATPRIRHARWDNFEKFISTRLNLYPYKPGMDFHEFDAVFIGSDQVWSKAHTGGKNDPVFFGEGFKCKVIPYAPSSINLDLNDEEKKFFREHLDKMAAISVREPKMKDILQPLTSKPVSVVVDPSLLAGRTCFEPLVSDVKVKRPYVLVYEIIGHREVYVAAKAMADSIGGDVVELTNGMRNYHRRYMHEDATPEEFVGYFEHAACVLTTSFHGTAFSLMFHTPFYTVLQGSSVDGRMVQLLKTLHMEDRTIKMGEVPQLKPLDDDKLQKSLDALTLASKEYIDKALINSKKYNLLKETNYGKNY